MIKRIFDVESYWKVVVYYDVDYSLFSYIEKDLKKAGAIKRSIDKIYDTLKSKAKAVTYSNTTKHISVVLLNRHDTLPDFINSIVHEAEHIKQAMLHTYKVDDKGEPPAYTVGYLVQNLLY